MEKTNAAASIMNIAAQAGLANLPNIGKSVQSTNGVSFTETFMKTSEVKSVDAMETNTKEARNTLQVTSKTVNNSNVKTANDTVTNVEDNKLEENEIKDLAKEVEDVINQIKEKIKDNFEVTDEEIEEAMEVLGLMMVDLTNGADLRNVIMELTGTKDSIDLLTNVELYDGLKEITAFAEDLMKNISEEFSLTNEQLTEIINSDSFNEILTQQIEAEASAVVGEEVETVVENVAENGKATELESDIKKDDKAVNTESVKTETENSIEPTEDQIKAIVETKETTSETKVEGENKQPELKIEVTKSEEVRTANPVKTEISQNENFSNGNERRSNLNENKNQEFTFQTVQQTQTVNTVGDIVETVTSYTSYADTENIIRQVTDFVKVNISEDVTKMEMQLHPASLGTVNMQINAQNGQITAHLTVQNELVKSILESQMIKLQETFNEQGTKVSAIEVTVANYNLDSKNDNNFSQSGNDSKRGNGRKSINLNEIGSFDELTDEEQLEAEVMEMNGSSVNYTA